MNQPNPIPVEIDDTPILKLDPTDEEKIVDVKAGIEDQLSKNNISNDTIVKPLVAEKDTIKKLIQDETKTNDKPEDKSDPIQYAKYSQKGDTRDVNGIEYAQYGKVEDDTFTKVWDVEYARYARPKIIDLKSGQELQETLMAPEYSPEQLQSIIELLGIIELSKSLLPEIRTWATKAGGFGADALQTWAAITIKKKLQDYLADQKVKAWGNLTLRNKAIKFIINNVEVLLELYNGYEVVDRAKPLKLSTKNKAKVYFWHWLDWLLSKLGAIGQITDFFFNSSFKSVSALETQIEEHKQTVRDMWVPEIYISDTVKWLAHYKNLQASYYDETPSYNRDNAADWIYVGENHFPHRDGQIQEWVEPDKTRKRAA